MGLPPSLQLFEYMPKCKYKQNSAKDYRRKPQTKYNGEKKKEERKEQDVKQAAENQQKKLEERHELEAKQAAEERGEKNREESQKQKVEEAETTQEVHSAESKATQARSEHKTAKSKAAAAAQQEPNLLSALIFFVLTVIAPFTILAIFAKKPSEGANSLATFKESLLEEGASKESLQKKGAAAVQGIKVATLSEKSSPEILTPLVPERLQGA